MVLKFRDWSIKTKIALTTIFLVTVSIIALGILTYQSTRRNITQTIETQLKMQAIDWKHIIEGTYGQIKLSQESSLKQSKSIISSQIEAVYQFVNQWTGDEEQLKNIIANIQVGKTGYVYVLGYDGRYVISKNRQRDAEDISDSHDPSGRYFIKELISRAKELEVNKVDYMSYPWQNPGEEKTREKSTVFVHVPKYKWIIGIGAYIDELTDLNYENNQLEKLKTKIAAQSIGNSGYIFILNSKGEYIVSKNRERDGENIMESKDAQGLFYIKAIIRKAHALNDDKSDFQLYPWQNKGEIVPRMKIAGISYIPELDWIIGVSAYYSDFFGPLGDVRDTVTIVVLLAILLATITAWSVSNIIVSPIEQLLKLSNTAAKGDLTVSVHINSKDEIGKLAFAFDQLIKSLSKLVLRIRETTEKVTARSENLSASAQEMNASTCQTSTNIQQIAMGANIQSKKADEVYKVMEQISVSVTQVAANARTTAAASEQASKSAQEGYAATLDAIKKMDKIVKIVTTSAETIKTLSDKTQEIGEIVNVITNISDQTNLLALNAAIEAARAGEAGRGFAVVAEEVRKLAENAARASDQISKLVKGVQEESARSLVFVEEGTKEVHEGKEISANVGELLKEITAEIERTRDMVQQISASTQEQIKGTEQTVKAVEEISELAKKAAASTQEASSATEEQTASMQELAASAQELSQMAVKLSETVSMFKVSEQEPPDDQTGEKKRGRFSY